MPPAKRLRTAHDDKVTLLVGTDREALEANAELLRNASEFFAAALKHDFKEAASRTIELPDCEPADFKLLISLLTFQEFVRPANAVTLIRLFSKFSMTPALIAHAEDVIEAELNKDAYEELGFDEPGQAWCEILMLAEDISSKKLREITIDGIDVMTDAPYMRSLVSNARYAEVVQILWPKVREWVLSPAQLESGEMAEPLPPEAAAIVWPAIVLSINRQHLLNCAPDVVRCMLPATFKRVTNGRVEGDEITDVSIRDGLRAKIKDSSSMVK